MEDERLEWLFRRWDKLLRLVGCMQSYGETDKAASQKWSSQSVGRMDGSSIWANESNTGLRHLKMIEINHPLKSFYHAKINNRHNHPLIS